MTESEQVQKILYEFVQLMGSTKGALSAQSQEWLFERLKQGPITIKEAIDLPLERKVALAELLQQYIIFLGLFSDLTFPNGFTVGSSETVLSYNILNYMLEHRWPFPQLIAH